MRILRDGEAAAGRRYGSARYNPSANYGASNFDIRDAFKGNVVYALPFGRGKMFVNHNSLLDLAVGGWQASSIIVLSTGNPFTPTVSGRITPSRKVVNRATATPGYPNQIGNPTLTNRTLNQWFNPAAFTIAPSGTFGDMRRNNIYGPGIELVNLSAVEDVLGLGGRKSPDSRRRNQRVQPSKLLLAQLQPGLHHPRGSLHFERERHRGLREDAPCNSALACPSSPKNLRS